MAELTPTEERNLRAVADVLEFWNARDVEGCLRYYHDDITWNNMGMGEVYRGHEGVGGFLTRLFTAFPDLHFEVTEKFARGDQVAEKWHMSGTLLGELMGIPPSGRYIEIPGMSMITLKDGKFFNDSFYFDALEVLHQIGIMPPSSVGETVLGHGLLWCAVNRTKVAAGLAGVALVAGSALAVRSLSR